MYCRPSSVRCVGRNCGGSCGVLVQCLRHPKNLGLAVSPFVLIMLTMRATWYCFLLMMPFAIVCLKLFFFFEGRLEFSKCI